MSLTTQLLRGALAMSLLLMFALLAFATTPATAQLSVQVDAAAPHAQVCRVEMARPRALLLAQTPADLGTTGHWKQACRA